MNVKMFKNVTHHNILEKAMIDLGRPLFAKGQAYVALSRVKLLDSL